MQTPIEDNLRQEKKLERRSWLGCAALFIVGGILMAMVTGLMDWIIPRRQTPGTIDGLAILFVLLGLVVIVAVSVGGMLLMFRIMRWSMTAEIQRHQRGSQIFKRALPELQIDQEAQPSATKSPPMDWKTRLSRMVIYFVGLVVVFIAADWLIGQIWHDAPGIISTFVSLAILVLIDQLLSSFKKRSQAQPGSQIRGTPSLDRMRIVSSILFFVVVMPPVLGVIPWVTRLPVPMPIIPMLALIVCTGIFMVMVMLYMLVPYFWIMAAVKQCKYDVASGRAHIVENLSILRGFYLNTHGVILLTAGRYDEARAIFETSIGEQRKEILGGGSTALENIGCALAWQGKYDEAIKMFEGSIAIAPRQAMVYNDLAEVYLHQGIELPRGLELIDRAWQNHQASFEARWLGSHQAGQILSTRAWALALLGQYSEAQATLQRAFVQADKNFRPVLAGVYVRAGYVMRLCNDERAAREHLAHALELDRAGHYGHLAQRALRAQ
ncbi:MAG: tetratricopeptide repeat protein [Chloroflexi bacterium]|nr:tetratricopeptide repeat protein [Chloroflexota bacterium]